MDLMMGLSAIKQTLEITKELRSVDKKIEDAELKLRLAEIVDKLLDAKKALIDAQEREVELRKEIGDLQSKQAMKAKLRDNNGLLFEIDDEGRNIGEPYCNLCAVRDEKYIRMRHHPAKQ
jgi:predicted  nucleic acid-binding Zn-ribbon protein